MYTWYARYVYMIKVYSLHNIYFEVRGTWYVVVKYRKKGSTRAQDAHYMV